MHHDFVLVKKSRINTKNKFDKMTSNYFADNKEELPFVKLRDDIILYILDTLKWIDSEFYNGEVCEKKNGISYHGITVFKDENAIKFKAILDCWINLFSLGNNILELQGEYHFSEEVDEKDTSKVYYIGGQYEKIKIEKRKLINNLLCLKEILEKAIDEKEYCVIHLGI